MKELSIFVDESGDFGDYAEHSSYYIISMVMHDQKNDISNDIEILERHLTEIGYPNHCLHAWPIIRNETPYRHEGLENRQKLLRVFMAFFRKIEVRCFAVSLEKKHVNDAVEAVGNFQKRFPCSLGSITNSFRALISLKSITTINGQAEVSKLLSSVFHTLLDNVEFRRVKPQDYRLFQAADFVATMKLLQIKTEKNELSNAEEYFFGNKKVIRKKYLKVLEDKTEVH